MALDFQYDITGLRGAEYNPRKIGQDDLAALAESIKELGLVKPLIVRGDLLVAGHQRTKALRALGVTRAPVYLLPRDTTYDEVRFNQLHNGTDLDSGDEEARITGGFSETGYQVVEPGRITGNFRARLAAVRAEICDLILRYGPWGGVVATKSGKVIHCAQYALAAALTRTKLTCYVIDDADEAKYVRRLSRQYGVFSYEHLEKETYIQTLAQMMRLRDGESGKENRSTLYENHVIPFLKANPKATVLDFGAGQGDYAARLRRLGFQVHDLEFFRRPQGQRAIDLPAVNRMIDVALAHVERHGGYDAVVCDSVMNSVDSLKAETAVMTMLNAFARQGCPVFFSGRKRERIDQLNRLTKTNASARYVEFLDEHGFTGLFRAGRWFYQKFHDGPQVERLAADHGLKIKVHARSKSSTSWQAEAVKVAELPWPKVAEAVEFEFNMPLGGGKTINRHGDALRVFQLRAKA